VWRGGAADFVEVAFPGLRGNTPAVKTAIGCTPPPLPPLTPHRSQRRALGSGPAGSGPPDVEALLKAADQFGGAEAHRVLTEGDPGGARFTSYGSYTEL